MRPTLPKLLCGPIYPSIILGLLLAWQSPQTFAQTVISQDQTSRTVTFDIKAIQQQLKDAPVLGSQNARSLPTSIDLPLLNGHHRFTVTESSIMHPDFEAAYPDFKTYQINSVIDPSMTGRLTVTPFGVGAAILAPEGFINIHPKSLRRPDEHVITQQILTMSDIQCQVEQQIHQQDHRRSTSASGNNGSEIRTYTLAIVTTGEFHNGNGGTVAAARAVVVSSVNSLQAIFERELAVRFQLLTPHVYTNPATDPFAISNRTLEAAEAVDANFSTSSYDFGHVFHTTTGGGSGIAYVGVICDNGSLGSGHYKAGGWSGSSKNLSSGWIGLAAHEFGHMFNMPHSFNGTGGNCTGNISSVGAYEIGSGSTIMSYQGSCSGQNVPGSGTADHYFHTHSIQRALDHLNSESCQTTANSGNTPPSISANSCGGNFTIPQNTPFRLTGSGSDADGDEIFYLWEQYDEDGSGTPTQGLVGTSAGSNTSAPLFRSYPPTTNPSRTFPTMGLVVSNQYSSDYEPLPTVARTLNFRFIGRDWSPNGGGIAWDDLQINVATSGPFALTAPNGGQTLSAGANTAVSWNVGGTGSYCSLVNIKLSVDGGYNYPYTLASNTSNDGSQTVTIPNGVPNTSDARVMVERADNTCVVFFDISNSDFSITSSCSAASSLICPDQSETFGVGGAGLNMNLSHSFFDGDGSSTTFNITSGSPEGQLADATSSGGSTCQTPWGQEKYVALDFTVSQAGDYAVSTVPYYNPDVIWSVFEADGFNPASPCSSTFLGSNAYGAISWSSSGTVTLNECTVYRVMVWSLSNTNVSNGVLNISGGGDVNVVSDDPGAGYDYTFAAVNILTNQVQAVNSSANFIAISSGSYLIHGVSYYSGAGPNPATVNPNNWVGQTMDQILSSGQCVLFSNNAKNISVTGPCPNSLVVNDNPILSNIYHADQQVTSAGNVEAGSNVMFMAGNSIELMPNFTTESSAVLEIRIQGCN